MKKIYNILFVLLAALTYTSCTSEVDDVFDKSSAERIAEALATDKQMLVDAPNGWLMEYFCEDTYGGYNMFVKFNDDNTVTVASEMGTAGARQTSHYKLEQSMGVLLSFDEHNELFHFFSEPANPFEIGTNGIGMRGDFEFRVIKAEADRFELQGKKHGAKIVMTRLAEDVDWDNYIAEVLAMEENLSYSKYQAVVDGADPLLLRNNYRTLTYTDAATEEDVMVTYIITPEGIKLSKPIEYGGKSISLLTYNGDDTWSVDGDNTVTIEPVLPSLVEQLLDENVYWSFVKGEMTPTAALYFAQAEAGSAAEREDIMFMALGVNPNATNLGWSFFFRSGNYIGTHTLDVTPIDDTHVALAIKGYDSNGQYYYQVGYRYITNGILRGTFELSTDNPKNPSYIRLTRTDGDLAGQYMDVFPGLQYYVQN
ncbi:MAG: DUF4302 domain-containing protein [Prevotella sp.]|nr:DUF4302 domain-containing protein [Prevotella sp.]